MRELRSGSCLAAEALGKRTDDALRHVDDEEHQHRAIDQHVEPVHVVAEGLAQRLGQQERDQRADRRPELPWQCPGMVATIAAIS